MQCCCTLLKPDGQMLIQAITIEDRRYQRAVSEIDFIKYYIFPGGCLPSVSRLTQAMAKASDFRLVQLEDIGLSATNRPGKWLRKAPPLPWCSRQRPAGPDPGARAYPVRSARVVGSSEAGSENRIQIFLSNRWAAVGSD
jgi:hypothetical protein